MGQLVNELKNQQKGKFPSDTEQNPRDHCKATTLISGKEVESSRQREERREEEKAEKGVEIEPDRPAEAVPTTILLQMVDRSLTFPRGIIEDVLVKVNKFIFSVDFVVLDMEEDREILLILG